MPRRTEASWPFRFLKTTVAEPLARKGGQALGTYFLSHPSLTGMLDQFNPDWRNLLSLGIKGGGGIAEIKGDGPLFFILNEALDSFFGGLGDAVEHFDGKSEDEIANNLFVISAVDTAVTRLGELLSKKVKLDLVERTFHFEGCAMGRGKPSTLAEAVGQGFAPKNCGCAGKVWNGFAETMEEDSKEEAKPKGPANIIQIVHELEGEAAENDDDILLGQVARFRAAMTGFPKDFRAELEQLAREDGAKENIRHLIGYEESDWPVVVDYMLKDPTQAKARGAIRGIVDGAGNIGSQAIGAAKAVNRELDAFVDGAKDAIRRNTEEVNLRYADQLRTRTFKRNYRKHQGSKRSRFALVAYFSFFFLTALVVYYGVTH